MTTPFQPQQFPSHTTQFNQGSPQVSHPPAAVPILQPAQVSRSTLSSAATADKGESNCCGGLVQRLLSPFIWLWEKLTGIFKTAQPDPVLQAAWDNVVEKEYDPVDAPNPFYLPEVNAGRRGRTIADHFVKAVAKTALSPQYKHILIYDFSNAGVLFAADGHYKKLANDARAGKFNSADTLIIQAVKKNHKFSQSEKQQWIQGRLHQTAGTGYPIENATIFVLDKSEADQIISNERMPKSLLALLQQKNPKIDRRLVRGQSLRLSLGSFSSFVAFLKRSRSQYN